MLTGLKRTLKPARPRSARPTRNCSFLMREGNVRSRSAGGCEATKIRRPLPGGCTGIHSALRPEAASRLKRPRRGGGVPETDLDSHRRLFAPLPLFLWGPAVPLRDETAGSRQASRKCRRRDAPTPGAARGGDQDGGRKGKQAATETQPGLCACVLSQFLPLPLQLPFHFTAGFWRVWRLQPSLLSHYASATGWEL